METPFLCQDTWFSIPKLQLGNREDTQFPSRAYLHLVPRKTLKELREIVRSVLGRPNEILLWSLDLLVLSLPHHITNVLCSVGLSSLCPIHHISKV